MITLHDFKLLYSTNITDFIFLVTSKIHELFSDIVLNENIGLFYKQILFKYVHACMSINKFVLICIVIYYT